MNYRSLILFTSIFASHFANAATLDCDFRDLGGVSIQFQIPKEDRGLVKHGATKLDGTITWGSDRDAVSDSVSIDYEYVRSMNDPNYGDLVITPKEANAPYKEIRIFIYRMIDESLLGDARITRKSGATQLIRARKFLGLKMYLCEINKDDGNFEFENYWLPGL